MRDFLVGRAPCQLRAISPRRGFDLAIKPFSRLIRLTPPSHYLIGLSFPLERRIKSKDPSAQGSLIHSYFFVLILNQLHRPSFKSCTAMSSKTPLSIIVLCRWPVNTWNTSKLTLPPSLKKVQNHTSHLILILAAASTHLYPCASSPYLPPSRPGILFDDF